MEHDAIPAGEIHAPHNWVVADEAARLALVVTEADLGKYCWQRDNESQWFLSAHDPAIWQPMETTVAWGDIADKPDLIEEGDSRLTDSRTPTGGAGGVLSGSFPNPGFAVDMATQGELDTQVTLLYTALDDLDAAKIDATEKGAANGVATLGADQKIPAEQLPAIAITDTFPVASEATMLALTAERGDIAVRSDLNKTFALAAEPASTLANWLELRTPTDAVLSVAGRTGAITLAKADVGLGNVDNTSDADKPVSTAQAAALTAHTGQSTGAHAATAISNTPAGSIAATTVQAAINELDTEKAAVAAVREKLTAARTYYVRTDGSDSNNGLTDSSGGAFLTVQKAVDTASSIDLGIYGVTIYVGAGTWTAPTTLKTLVGAGKVIIRGTNADMTSTVVHTTGDSCFSGSYSGRYRFEWLRLQATTAGYCIIAYGGGAAVEWANVDFGSTATTHVACVSGARAESVGPYKISGGGYAHAAAYDNATLQLGAHTTTITGTPAMSTGFVISARGASVVAVGPSFSGTTAGPRYNASLNGTIITAAGETFLPGDTAGAKDSGGQYA